MPSLLLHCNTSPLSHASTVTPAWHVHITFPFYMRVRTKAGIKCASYVWEQQSDGVQCKEAALVAAHWAGLV